MFIVHLDLTGDNKPITLFFNVILRLILISNNEEYARQPDEATF